MGSCGVPSAIILAPRVIIKAAFVPLSPLIIVPASMVSVALFFTYTKPCMKYTLLFVQVVLAVISPDTFTTGLCA